MAKITYSNKTDNQTSALPAINKVTAADLNEIKTSVNDIYDTLGGFAFYEDATTSGTPINLTAETWTDLTNDKAGADTHSHLPSYISGDLWDSATNKIDTSKVGANKVLLIRNDFDVTAGAANTRLDARLYFPDTGKSIEFSHDNIASNGDQVRYSRTTQIFTRTSELTSGCKIQIKVDKSGATAIVEDFVITVLSF
jgi:hypothetical protein